MRRMHGRARRDRWGLRRVRGERGQSFIEYAVVITLVAAALLTVFTPAFQATVTNIFTDASSNVGDVEGSVSGLTVAPR